MTRKPGKAVLFVSHDATRTGAPIIFCNQLRWLKENTDIPFEILLKEGGELEQEFGALAPLWRIEPASQDVSFRERLWARLRRRSNPRILRDYAIAEDLGGKFVPGLIYSNTITNGELLERLRGFGCPIVTHVHELDFWMRQRLGERRFRLVDDNTDIYITVSDAVSRSLIDNWGVHPNRIRMIHGFIPVIPDPMTISTNHVCAIRSELGIPDDAFVVGGSGTTDWRKAPEYFVQLAYYVRKRNPDRPVHFLWVGGDRSGDQFAALRHELRLCRLENQVHFVGAKSNPLEHFAVFDLFAMVSREDPFPLVNMEAASLGKPIICFDGAGGSPEFVESDAGIVVPYLDLDGMAEAIVGLIRSTESLHRLGDRARAKVLERHDIGVQVPKIATLIRELLSQPSRVPAK